MLHACCVSLATALSVHAPLLSVAHQVNTIVRCLTKHEQGLEQTLRQEISFTGAEGSRGWLRCEGLHVLDPG